MLNLDADSMFYAVLNCDSFLVTKIPSWISKTSHCFLMTELELRKLFHWQSVLQKQCCGSRMIIPDPGSRIPDPKTATKERGEKKIVFIPLFGATNFTKF
jgi:hypothetical protein